MMITVSDLDKDIKKDITSTITVGLFKQFGTLPQEEEKIDEVVNMAPIKKELDDKVQSYFASITERDVSVDISTDDYKRVFLNLV